MTASTVADLRLALKDIGSTVELVDCGQGYKDFAPCVSNFIEAAVSGKLRHGGHPVLTAAVMGAAVVSGPRRRPEGRQGQERRLGRVPDRPGGRGHHGRRCEA